MARSSVVTTFVTFVAWAALALLSNSLSDSLTHSASVWLATGVTFGALLALKADKRPAVLIGAGLAATVFGLLDGLGVLPALGFGLTEVFSAGLGAWVARQFRTAGPDGQAHAGKAYAGLLLGALLTSALGASMAIMLWSWALPQPLALTSEFRVWLCTSFVGILLVAPLVNAFAGFRVQRSGGMGTAPFVAGATTLVMFFVVAGLIFSSDVSDRFGASLGPTLTYLPLPFMVVTAILWKERGATLATLLGALALISWTRAGGGPFSEIEGFAGEAVIEVQGYVAVMALLVGVVNALGSMNAQALAQARDWRTRYRQVLESNRTVVANFDAKTGQAQWSEGADELLRTPTASLRTMQDFIHHTDPQEQPAMQTDWRDLTQGQRDNVLWKNTLRWRDGKAVSMNARLSSVRGADGQVEQVAALLEVEAAHAR